MKIKTLIGAIVAVLVFLTAVISFLFLALPEKMVQWTGIGPLDHGRLLTLCLSVATVLILLGWLIEKAFDRAGKSGVQVLYRKNQRAAGADESPLSLQPDAAADTFSAASVTEHLSLRYDRSWKRKVRILLVQGSNADIEKAVPGLKHDLWQESDGVVLIHGGDAEVAPDEAFLQAVRQLRPRRPIDGIVQVINADGLPTEAQRDACVRHRQKADKLLGWQAPVWLWLVDKDAGEQDGREMAAVGSLFGQSAAAEEAVASLDGIVPRLRTAGMVQLLNDVRHDWLLRLSARLHGDLKTRLTLLLTGLMQGPAPYRLRGIMISPELAGVNTAAHVRLSSPAWQALEEDSRQVTARKLTFDWLKTLRMLLLSLIALWCAGTVLSLAVNRTQIYQAQETARLAADTTLPLPDRLRNQLMLQQAIARLQYRESKGAPWYTRFGLNQDADTLTAFWPLYARNNNLLMRDATAALLRQQLDAFVQLPPARPEPRVRSVPTCC